MRIERICLTLTLLAGVAHAQPPASSRATSCSATPRSVSPQLSPDGKRLAWLAPDKKNVLQVWVKTVGKDDDKVVTADKKRGIRQYFWAENNKDAALPAGHRRRRELPRLRRRPRRAATSATSRRSRACGPQSRRIDPKFPDDVLVALNVAQPQAHRRLPPRPQHRRADARHREPRRRRRLGGRRQASRSAPRR